MRFRTAREAEDYLLSFVNYEARTRYRRTARTHDLVRFAGRLAAMGWDPGAVPTVHIGGTNGKGTVAHLIERIQRAAGERTGLYTSPHLHRMRERVRVEGRPIPAPDFARAVSAIAGRFEEARGEGFRTTFEHLTALAFLYFQERQVDRAVVEVGLGRRLDATNVIPPGPALLTPISLDHGAVLGRRVAAIAEDKAWILKRGGRAFLMPQSSAALAPIRRRLAREGLVPVHVREVVEVEISGLGPSGASFRIRGREDYGVISTGLLGAHQTDNIAAAVAMAESLLSRRACLQAVPAGLRDAVIPGRLEPLRFQGRAILLDGGHNPAAARAVARTIRLHYPQARVVALVGMARDKEHRAFLSALAPVVDTFVFTRSDGPRAAPPRLLADRAERSGPCVEGVSAGLDRALALQADLLLVTGSFLVVAEARKALGRGAA